MLKFVASSVLACCGLVCSVCDACNCGHCDCGCPCSAAAISSVAPAQASAPAPMAETAQATSVQSYRTYSYQPAPVTTYRSYNYAPMRSSGNASGFHDAAFKARGGF